jgi:ABC-type polysaccharide/polyol phosphate export permease
MTSSIKEIWNYRDMIWSLVRRELRGKYEKSILEILEDFFRPVTESQAGFSIDIVT